VTVVVVGHADIADVDVLGLAARFELERDLGEVGLLEEELRAMQTFGRDVGCDVVGVDDAVDGFEFGHGLDVDFRVEVEVELVSDEVLLGSDFAEDARELLLQAALDALELRVCCAQVLLFDFECLVHVAPLALVVCAVPVSLYRGPNKTWQSIVRECDECDHAAQGISP